jgi:hypothetical protein
MRILFPHFAQYTKMSVIRSQKVCLKVGDIAGWYFQGEKLLIFRQVEMQSESL